MLPSCGLFSNNNDTTGDYVSVVDSTQSGTTILSDTTEVEVPLEPVSFFEKGTESEYVLVRSSTASTAVKTACSNLYDKIKSVYELNSFKLTTDWYNSSTAVEDLYEYEILVGNTNRPETKSVYDILGVNDYMIKVVGTKLVICGGSEDATNEAIEYFTNTYLGLDTLVLEGDHLYCKSDAPIMISTYPEQLYYFEKDQTPEILLNYICAPSVDETKTTVIIGDVDYADDVEFSPVGLVFKNQTLPYGDHVLKLHLVSTNGGELDYEYKFTYGDGSDLQLYCGEVHAHTVESDGEGTVDEAYAYARDVADLDYFSITDHSNSFTDTVYDNVHKVVADSYNEPGTFAALYGYEQTYNYATGYYGHYNVINSPEKVINTLQMKSFYSKMSLITEAVGMFNHPGYTWGNFLEYDMYCAQYDTFMNLIEVKGSSYDTEYALCLTKGWHVSPVYNEDNHHKNWGTTTEAVGYVLAGSLTRQNVLEGFQKNRTYTTTDKSLKIYYSINGEWMGSRLDNPSTLNIKVDVSTEKSTGLGTIYVVGEDNIIVASKVVGMAKSYVWELQLPATQDYYYVKVVNTSIWAVTAPVWVTNRDLINITDMDMGLLENNSGLKDYFAVATVKNESTETMTGVVAKFYSSTYAGLDFTKYTPFATINVGDIQAGETVKVSGTLAYLISSNRVSVAIEGNIGSEKYFDTAYVQLSSLYMTEIVPMGNYEYIEIYNNSDVAKSLSGNTIRYYPKAGASATDLAANTWTLSGTIAPHSSMVVWITSSETATIANFNNYYKTNLVEGESIIKVTSSVAIPASNAVQIELLYATVVVNRIWYNWGDRSMSIANEKAITYDYQDLCTLTSIETDYIVIPTPGTVTGTQVPLLITAQQWQSDYLTQ